MNRVTPQTPLPEVVDLMQRDGYVLMENALAPQQVAEIASAYNQIHAQHPRAEGSLRTEVKRILEHGPVFEQLMDWPPVFAVARAVIGADLELASGGELDHKYGNTPAYIGWHNDFQWMVNVPYPRQNFWLRCTYFIDEVSAAMGPFTLLPGSHHSDHACPTDLVDQSGQPRAVEGMIGITGPAGSCLINNTEIWHTNTPNRSERDRRLIMILYKHAWMKQWQESYETSAEFAARQTDPLRRQLCGC
ncbi:MAG TPA: phytanoyl-CoA dioxygenase family protein, partial [Abditibacteriaceae bacterium]|nr:phytanoyl-CoA dioxygenase family protein [Abditibacteriaceae bacterium]